MKINKPLTKLQKISEASFYNAIASIKSLEEAKGFFQDLCTPAELQAMVDRWLVVDLLHQDKSYRTINEITGVSVTTIGRVARSLSLGEGGYEKIYQRCKRKKS